MGQIHTVRNSFSTGIFQQVKTIILIDQRGGGETLHMTSEGLGEMFVGSFAETCKWGAKRPCQVRENTGSAEPMVCV